MRVLFLDYGTRKLHMAAWNQEEASWPASACGIDRQRGRPWTFWECREHCAAETCKRCRKARGADGFEGR